MRLPHPVAVALTLLPFVAGPCRADPNVVVSAFANPDYTKAKFGGEKPRAESYVVMQGRYFEGMTVDHSLERMPFQRILNFFAPELARREYWPARSAADADLLIVVHWGTTNRMVSSQEMLARDSVRTDTSQNPEVLARNAMISDYSPGSQAGIAVWLNAGDPEAKQLQLDSLDFVTDQVRTDFGMANNAQLLGYTRELRKLSATTSIDPGEITLKSDMTSERYFVILRAYDLREKMGPGKSRRAVWTLHLNMRSPGINFPSALDRMSAAAANYFGRATDSIATVTPHAREGKVEVGTPVVVGEKK